MSAPPASQPGQAQVAAATSATTPVTVAAASPTPAHGIVNMDAIRREMRCRAIEANKYSASSTQQRARPPGTMLISPPPQPTTPPAPQIHDPRRTSARSIDLTDSIVTVRVSDPPVSFNIHSNILQQSSDFFKAKAKPVCSKSDEAVVDLPDHSPDVFAIYSKWFYTHCISSPPESWAQLAAAGEDPEWRQLAQAYLLREELIDSAFQDAVMDALRAKAIENRSNFWRSSASLTWIIYDGTASKSSKARSWLVDMYHAHADARERWIQIRRTGAQRDSQASSCLIFLEQV